MTSRHGHSTAASSCASNAMNQRLAPIFLLLGLAASTSLHANNLSDSAQFYLQLQHMQQEINELRGLVEEQQHQLRRLEQQAQPNMPASVQVAETDSALPVVAPQVEPGDPAREEEFYNAAYSLIRQRDFPRAQQAFDIFLKKYPNGQYAANAHYWYGEVCLAQQELELAGQSFAKVIHSWPEHSKATDSMYKLAIVEKQLGQTDKARQILQSIVSEHPRSSAANLARQELQRLNGQ